MPGLRNLSLASSKIPSRPGLGNLSRKNSLADSPLKKKTTTFHQFGDSISLNRNNKESTQVYGSVHSAIKSRQSTDFKTDKTRPDPAAAFTSLPPDNKI